MRFLLNVSLSKVFYRKAQKGKDLLSGTFINLNFQQNTSNFSREKSLTDLFNSVVILIRTSISKTLHLVHLLSRDFYKRMKFLSSFQAIFLGMFFLVKFALSKKHGLVEITSSNYETLVTDGEKDAWIVAVKGAGKVSLDEWKETEFSLRGLFVRVGIIDPEKDGAFLKRKVRQFKIQNSEFNSKNVLRQHNRYSLNNI